MHAHEESSFPMRPFGSLGGQDTAAAALLGQPPGELMQSWAELVPTLPGGSLPGVTSDSPWVQEPGLEWLEAGEGPGEQSPELC